MNHAVLRPASRRWRLKASGTVLAVLALSFAGLAAPAVASATGRATSSELTALSPEFNRPGNILIADQFNNRVIEVDPAGHIVWQFGKGPNDFSRHSIIGTNDAQRVGPFTLMAGTGDPPVAAGSSPPAGDLCPDLTNGCPDNRVILVDPFGHIVWQYGQFGAGGSGPGQLNTPVQATWLPNGHVLITDQANERIIEVTLGKRIVWQYGMTGVTGSGPDQLNNPNSAELLANGHILISDENNNRAIEVTHDNAKKIVATFTAGGTASGVAFASRLPNGDTLLTDSNNSRVVEVNSKDQPVWQYFTNDPAGNLAPLPTRAIRLKDGETLISDQFNDRVIEVVRTGSLGGTIERQLGTLNMFGIGNGLLDAPYDAKVIGDYTGLTPPFGFKD
jgi:outer membrane protein assembly factor BamB